jgi:large subunit ribosomal protein L9
MIDVILLEKVGRLGQIGQVVKVRPGYARNFLLPNKKALRATKDNLAYFETQREHIEAANAESRSKAETGSKKLEGKKFTVLRQASEVGQLFGSVTVRDVADLLQQGGIEVDRQDILLPAPIKQLGLFPVRIRLHAEVTGSITLNIARNEDEAKVQEKTGQVARAKEQATEDALKAEAARKEAEAAFFEKPPEATSEEATEESKKEG